MTSVSIIIINWNSGLFLSKCLGHVEKQTVSPVEIIVVDNASTDGSERCAQGRGDVKLLQAEDNLGFAAGNNFALRHCTTDFVVLLNPDAFPEPDWLECLLGAAHKHPDIAAFGSRQLCDDDPQILDGIGDVYHFSGLPWRERHLMRQKATDLVSREIFSPCAAAALYRRQALENVGGFDEDYFCYIEDVDLGFRLRLAGHKALFVPDAVVRHVGSATTGGGHSEFSLYHGHRNVVATFFKNVPQPLLWGLLPFHVMMNIAVVVWFACLGKGHVIWRAKLHAVKQLPRTLGKRKKIQNERTASNRSIWQALDKTIFPS